MSLPVPESYSLHLGTTEECLKSAPRCGEVEPHQWGVGVLRYLLCLLVFCLSAQAGVLPNSFRVTVIDAKGNERLGMLYTGIDPMDRESLKPPVRIKPLVVFAQNAEIELAWQEQEPIITAISRLRETKGIRLFEMEDGTWTFGDPEGFTVKRGMLGQELYLTVRIQEFVTGARKVAMASTVPIHIPIQDVADRVFTMDRHLDLDNHSYFMNVPDDGPLAVVVLGFGFNKVYVALRSEMESSFAKKIRILRLPLETLRIAPQQAFIREGTIDPDWVRTLVVDAVPLPNGTRTVAGRRELAREVLRARNIRFDDHFDFNEETCSKMVAGYRRYFGLVSALRK